MLQAAVEAELAAYIDKHKEVLDGDRGHQPQRTAQCGLDDISVKKPGVHDRRGGKKFTSSIPPT